jgi:hypothetical protein
LKHEEQRHLARGSLPAARRSRNRRCSLVAVNHPPSCRTALRVTKYDPTLRVGRRGGFTGDDWTTLSDVGGTFGGRMSRSS